MSKFAVHQFVSNQCGISFYPSSTIVVAHDSWNESVDIEYNLIDSGHTKDRIRPVNLKDKNDLESLLTNYLTKTRLKKILNGYLEKFDLLFKENNKYNKDFFTPDNKISCIQGFIFRKNIELNFVNLKNIDYDTLLNNLISEVENFKITNENFSILYSHEINKHLGFSLPYKINYRIIFENLNFSINVNFLNAELNNDEISEVIARSGDNDFYYSEYTENIKE